MQWDPVKRDSASENVPSDNASNSRITRIALGVIAVSLAAVLLLGWWSNQGIPTQVAKLAGYDHLKMVRQARDQLAKHLNELRYKIRVLSEAPDIITPKNMSVDEQIKLDKYLTELDLAEVQIRRFDAEGNELLALPAVGQRFPRPKISERQELVDWGKGPDSLYDVRTDIVNLLVGVDRQSSHVLRYCTPVMKDDQFDGILCMWVSSDYLLSRYLIPIQRPQSYTFALQTPLGATNVRPTLLLHSAEPDWTRGGGKDTTIFLDTLGNETLMFEELGDDYDIVSITQRDGRTRKEVLSYASTLFGSHRWVMGLSTPFEVVIEPYVPYRSSMILLILLTLCVLAVLLGLLFYQRQRLQSEAIEQRRQQLREMQHDYRELFAENPIAMLIINDDNQLADCNYSAERLIGISKQEGLGHRVVDLFEDGSMDPLWESLRERGYIHVRDHELVRRSDQVTIVVETWGRRIGDHWIIMANDVEQRRDLERQISRLRRMDSMGSLASTLAHDFNNLLGQVQILVSNLRADLDPAMEHVESDLAAIEEKVDDASQLVANLMAFREDVVSKEIVWLEPLLREYVSNEKKILPTNVDLEFQVSDEPPPVWITPYAMRRVLDNLCRNALDAMPYGGKLRIRLFPRNVSENQAVDQVPAGRYAVVEVSDTGTGMSPEMLDTIFEPFFSTKAEGSGTGLGLWTVYKIVRRAGGAVNVRSRMGKGTRFTIHFPTEKPREDQS